MKEYDMMKSIFATSTLTLALAITGCARNPAEGVTPAEVTPAVTTPAPAAPAAGAKVLNIDASKSTIGFTGSKVTGHHDGGFKTFTGTFSVVDGKLAAAGSTVVIDMTSLFTDAEKLTGHLKGPDFFNVDEFPTTTFVLTEVNEGELKGDLTLHGVTKNIAVPAEMKLENGVLEIKATFSLMRFDFDIKYPGKADDLIRDEVVVKLAITAN